MTRSLRSMAGTRDWPGPIWLTLAVLALLAGDLDRMAWADETSAAAYNTGALPGMHRVNTAEPVRGVGGFAGAGYGYTGEIFGLGDSHHRANGTVAVAAGIGGWLAFGVRFDGRYDRHQGMADEPDDGLVGDPRILFQLSRGLGESLRLGTNIVVWLPGSNAPSVVTEAISGDVIATLGYLGMGGRLRAAANVGYRLDRSAASAPDADQLSPSDRLSLGVSDSDAILLGLGLGYRLGSAELFAEFTTDRLIGENAPSPDTSPMRVAAGASIGLSDALAARLIVESNLSSAPEVAVGKPLVPYEPRLSIIAGVHYRFGASRPKDGPLVLADGDGDDDGTDDKPEDKPADVPPVATVSGRVLAEDGSGLAGARVEATSGDMTRSATTDADGGYRIEDIPAGKVALTITADGFDTVTRELELQPGGEEALDSNLAKALPNGQLRGLVRAFSGKGVNAAIEVQPLGIETTTNDQGEFEIDVPPGDYTVIIEAKGFRGQRRQVSVQEDGVTIIQVDMRRKR